MDRNISLQRVWSDEDVDQLHIVSSDGCSTSCVTVYVARALWDTLVRDLDRFKTHLHGGLYDLKLGEFGPEFAGGAVLARLHFYPPGRGRLCITVNTEGEWEDFGMSSKATRATLHLHSEPGLLDDFISQLTGLGSRRTDKALLKCV
jgi:hypothetical protein